VNFDVNADGSKVNTGWVGQGDGLLVMDRNGDGQINDGRELFGTATDSTGGGKTADGFAALGEIDSNHDGVIDSKDAQFGDLRVWVDVNADGVSQADELKTLASLGVASLKVGADKASELNNGNWVGLTSSYTSTDGTVHDMADVWFRTNRTANVSALTQAIAGYGQQDAAGSGSNPGGTLTTPAEAAQASAASASLSGSVAALGEQMRQFDAATGLSGSATAQGEQWLRKPDANGILAAR
jgi:hypothetical protein